MGIGLVVLHVFLAAGASADPADDDKSCRFYRIGPNGRTVVAECPIRKTDGVITEITWRGKHLRFQLEDGIVTGVSGP